MIKRASLIATAITCIPLLATEFNHDYHVGIKHGYRRMKFDNPSKLDGFMTGLSTGFNFSKKYFIANINYDGYWNTPLLRGNPCQTSKVHEHLVSFSFGGCFKKNDRYMFKALVGLGFDRFLNHQDPNDCPGNQTDGLYYYYNKLFVPVTVCGSWMATDHTTIGLSAQWRPDVFARLKVRIKQNDCTPLLCCTLKNERRHGVHVAAPITHKLHRNDRFYIQITPFFDWNRFGGICACNQNGNPYSIEKLTNIDAGVYCLFGTQF